MKITFKMTKKDWAKASMLLIPPEKNKTGISRYLFTEIPIVCSVIMLIWFTKKGSHFRDMLIGIFVLFFLVSVLFEIFILKKKGRFVKVSPELLEPITMEITEDCCIYKTGSGEEKYTWDAIKDIQKTGEFIIVHFSNDKVGVMPSHAFSTPTEKEEFYQNLKAFSQNPS